MEKYSLGVKMPRPANPYDDFEIMGSTNPNNFVPAIQVGNNVGGQPRAVVAAPGSTGERQALGAADFANRNRVTNRARQVSTQRGTKPSRPTSVTPNRRQRAAGAVKKVRRGAASLADRAANRVRRGRRR